MLAAVPEAKHKLWPHDVPHLHYHECAEMAATYLLQETCMPSKSFNLPPVFASIHDANSPTEVDPAVFNNIISHCLPPE